MCDKGCSGIDTGATICNRAGLFGQCQTLEVGDLQFVRTLSNTILIFIGIASGRHLLNIDCLLHFAYAKL